MAVIKPGVCGRVVEVWYGGKLLKAGYVSA